jgi:hypothetical protein
MRFNFSLFVGIIVSVFLIWNRLRTRFPQNVPIEFNYMFIELFFKSLPVLFGMILILKIKNLVYPNASLAFMPKIEYFQKIIKQIYQDLSEFIYEIVWLKELMLFLFNILVFGKIMVVKADLSEILGSKRFYILVILSQILVLIPELVLYMVGLFEIYILGEIHYLYLLLPGLFVPLIWKAYIYVLYEFYSSRIEPEANPSFQIIWPQEEHPDINKVDLIPIADDTKNLSNTELLGLVRYYRYLLCRYFLCKIIRMKNDTVIERYSILLLLLRIFLFFGLFYSLPPMLPIDPTILIPLWE